MEEAQLLERIERRPQPEKRVAVKDATLGVVIPTYNRSSLLTQCLDCVLNQTRPPDVVFVIDDGSTDDTAEAVKRYGKLVRYVVQSNAGKSAALNRGLSMLDSDYVWLMDDDDIPLPDALERHLTYLVTHQDVDFSYSGCYQFNGSSLPTGRTARTLDDLPEPPAEELLLHCLKRFPFFMQSMLVPRRCYLNTGPFDERLKRGQDYDMILRLARRYRGGKIQEPTFLLRQHGGTRGPARERHLEGNRMSVWRHYDLTIFSRVREQLELREYLPGNMHRNKLSPAQRRRALLQRACIMARRGLFPEALTDIRAATEPNLASLPVTDQERLICTMMMDLSPASLGRRFGFTRQVGQLIEARLAPLLKDCSKGLWWSFSREWHNAKYPAAMLMVVHYIQLATSAYVRSTANIEARQARI